MDTVQGVVMGAVNQIAGEITTEISQEITGTATAGARATLELPGLRVVRLRQPAHTEFFITATPVAGEPFSALVSRLAALLVAEGASPVSMEVFGLPSAAHPGLLQEAWGKPAFPVTWLEPDGKLPDGETPDGKLLYGEMPDSAATALPPGIQLWAVAGQPVAPLRLGGRVVGSFFEAEGVCICRLGGLLPPDLAAPPAAQARAMFELMIEALTAAGMEFSHVARTWFYNHRMLEWYDAFNRTRTAFFKENGVFDGLVPASTAVGGANAAGSALTGGLLALAPRADYHASLRVAPVASPLQCPALEYGSSFSRAVEIASSGQRRLLVSGTASIAPEGQSLHPGDVAAQIARTLRVVGAMLDSRGFAWSGVSRAIAYFKHAVDARAFAPALAAAGLAPFPVLLATQEVCRDDLLFELELDALTGRSPGAPVSR